MALGGAFLIALLALGLVETLLATLGLGVPRPGFESGLKYQRVYLPTLVPDALADGTPVLATEDPRFAYQWIAPLKPAGTLRVFCFGGSATAGLGFSPNVTFPRYLDQMLRNAAPDVRVEVLNLGLVALPASGVRWLVRDVCERYEPDLLVVYAGNNEFLEPHSRAYFQATASLIERGKQRLSETHLWRLVRGTGHDERPTITTREVAANDRRIEHREMLKAVHLSADDERGVLDAYEIYVTEIANTANAAGVPLMLCTVASNVEWWAMEDPGLEWIDTECGGDQEAALVLAKERVAALSVAGASPADLPSPLAEAHLWAYRLAQLLEQNGQTQAATEAFERALELDPHRRRATVAHAERVRRVAQATGCALYDARADLKAQATNGRVGFDAFYDYVHFAPLGAQRVAAGILARGTELGLFEALNPALGREVRDFDAAKWIAAENARIQRVVAAGEDELGIGHWMGVGLDAERLGARDLWKYDRAQDDLDRAVETSTEIDRARALAHRGNARFFQVGGREKAAADYRAALELQNLPEVRANLDILLTTHRP